MLQPDVGQLAMGFPSVATSNVLALFWREEGIEARLKDRDVNKTLSPHDASTYVEEPDSASG